jgi:hypothetical protein
VSLIEDEDLEAIANRREDCALAKVAGIVNTVVACGVDFDDV